MQMQNVPASLVSSKNIPDLWDKGNTQKNEVVKSVIIHF